MGTWGTGALDNDIAADFVWDVGDGGLDVLLPVLHGLDDASDAFQASLALAAAEIVAASGAAAAAQYAGDEGLKAAVAALGGQVGDDTVSRATEVVQRCARHGELAQLWDEDAGWVVAVAGLVERLSSLPKNGRDDGTLAYEEDDGGGEVRFEFAPEAQRLIKRLGATSGAKITRGPVGAEIEFATERCNSDGSRPSLHIRVDWDSVVEVTMDTFCCTFDVSDDAILRGLHLADVVEGFRLNTLRLVTCRLSGVEVGAFPARAADVESAVADFFAGYRPSWLTRQALRLGKTLVVVAEVQGVSHANDRNIGGTLSRTGFEPDI